MKRAAGLGIPPGGAQADKGRHQVDRLHGVGLGRQRPALVRRADDSEPVPEPLHRGAGDKDRTFERVGRNAIQPIGDGGQQPVARPHHVGTGIDEGETAGAIGRFHHARREAGLADDGRVLVAGDAADRHGGAEHIGIGDAEIIGAVLDLGQQGARHAKHGKQRVVPFAFLDIVHQRARGVGRVGRMHLAAGEPPDEEGIDRAEGQFAAFGTRPDPGHVLEDPSELGAGEIGIDQQPGAPRKRRARSPCASVSRKSLRCACPARRWPA